MCASKPPSGSTGAASQPLATSGSSATISGLPANADTLWYGELAGPIGAVGSSCQTVWPATASQSTNCSAAGPKSPMPCGPGKEVVCSSTPAERF